MRRPIIDRLRGVVLGEESINEARGKAVATAHAIQNLQARVAPRLIKQPVVPADGTPIVDRRCVHAAQGRRRRLEIRELRHRALDHLLKALDLDVRDILVHPLDLKTQAGRKILLVADHHVDRPRNLAVDLLRLGQPADRLPERGAVIQIIGNNHAVLLGRLHRLQRQRRRRLRERSENPARVEPPRATLAKQLLPVDIAALHLAGRSIRAIRHTHRPANPMPALGKVQPIAHLAPNPIISAPLHIIGSHAALQNKILDQPPNLVIRKGRHHGCLQSKTAPQPARHIILAAALPSAKLPRRPHPTLTRIEPQHDLAQRDTIKFTFSSWSQFYSHARD